MDSEVVPLIEKSDTFEYCLWFHDVIYDPQSKENEVKSADMFK